MREVEVETATPSDSASSVGIPVVEQNEAKEQPRGAEAPEQRDLFARTQRRKLPDERKSVTHKFSVGGHEGYIIVGMYEEGTPGEIFIKMAKEGSTLSGFMDGVAVSISIGLQYGVPLKILVDKLTNTRFEPSGFTENPSIRYASSILDYIARWLGGKFLSPEYLKPRALNEPELNQAVTSAPFVNTKDREPAHRGNGSAKAGDAPSCPTCGMLMVPNGSCYKCVNCGSTSGCS
jgi:ribonucleoside-diphosphate reductase alpha chain